ncbi:hypothetical protein F5Y17DRAFT_412012 [Xylariaceae sp. FL0594]|nr:hypothetical protein F5Y17DRAFT_412012 [Xylariaceae sp. FL0594]
MKANASSYSVVSGQVDSMSGQGQRRPPFTTRVIEMMPGEEQEQQNGSGSGSGSITHLPASRRTKKDHIVAPEADADFLRAELGVKKLTDILDWLWVCGRPMPPRSLHHQVVISRDIIVTENPELHLVWSNHRIFVKPLPSWLLDPEFWERHLLQEDDDEEELARCARGFLYSYTALIAYESDFRIAEEKGLVPRCLTWPAWKGLAREVLREHDMALVNPRYWYGELRLGRLNKVYRLRMGYLFRGYSKVSGHTVYSELVRDNFTALATVLGYVVIVLTSLQVGLGTDRLTADAAFQDFSYGFTVFSIVAPLVAVVAIVVFVLAMFVSDWRVTMRYQDQRFREMGVEAYWRRKGRRRGKEAASSMSSSSVRGAASI